MKFEYDGREINLYLYGVGSLRLDHTIVYYNGINSLDYHTKRKIEDLYKDITDVEFSISGSFNLYGREYEYVHGTYHFNVDRCYYTSRLGGITEAAKKELDRQFTEYIKILALKHANSLREEQISKFIQESRVNLCNAEKNITDYHHILDDIEKGKYKQYLDK